MGVIRSILGAMNGKGTFWTDGPIERDERGYCLYAKDLAARILTELERRREERRPYELQWQLNANFLAGNQHCDINPNRNSVENLPEKHDYEERAVYNRITPLYETRLAHLQKVNYAMRVNPRTDELDDYEKAEISTKLLRYWQGELNFREMKNRILSWCEIAGSCFALSGWDACGGKEVARVMRATADENAVEVQEEYPVFEGALTCSILSPYEVFPENVNAETVDEQHSVIIEQIMSVDEIYDQYGILKEGRELSTYSLMPSPGSASGGYEHTTFRVTGAQVRNCERVVTYLERPCRRHPEGVLALLVGDELIHYGALPYSEIPLVAVKSKVIAGKFFGKSVIEDLIPLQRAYNGCKNKIHDHVATIAAGGFFAQEGSIDLDEIEENGTAPGAVIVYKNGHTPPTPRSHANLPGEVYAECAQLARDMEYAAGVSQLMVSGAAAAGVQSGTAINNLRDIDETRMSLSAENMRTAVINIAKNWLAICKRFSTGYSTLEIAGSNEIGNVVTWCSEDINSFDIEYTTENELVLSPEKQKQDFIEALQTGLFTDEQGRIPQRVKRKALEMQKLGTFGELTGIDDLHATKARRENTYVIRGVIPEVAEYDDHEIHVDEHMRAVLQREFEMLKRSSPKLAEAFLAHVEQHKKASASDAAPAQMQALAQMMAAQKGANGE